ncbi:MAG: hypothetical protein JSU86_00580 [Phycisphaerales bacterium]|nr:MAG: hypothetical protein JSU86_00580 [Phycisphaerales bacterium]
MVEVAGGGRDAGVAELAGDDGDVDALSPELGGGAVTGSRVSALLAWDDGTGPALYVAGWHLEVDGTDTRLAKWDGEQWYTFRNVNSGICDMCVFDDGLGSALYIGGWFPGAMAPPSFKVLNYVAKSTGWDWEPLGYGVMLGVDTWAVDALAVFDDGGGPALYVGGDFHCVFNTPDDYFRVSNIARWEGAGWYGVGGGVPHQPPDH